MWHRPLDRSQSLLSRRQDNRPVLTDVSVLVRTILRDLSDNCVTLFSPTKAASVGAEPSNTVPATICAIN